MAQESIQEFQNTDRPPLPKLSTFLIVLALLFGSVSAPEIRAEEPAQEFLEALREKRYYDMALEYLDQMATSPLATDEFKKRIPFERAATLIQSTETVRDFAVWEQRLGEAEQLLNKYAGSGGSPQDNARTQEYIGDLHRSRSQVYMNQSKSDRLTVDEKNAILASARQNYNKSRTAYKASANLFKEAVTNFQEDPQDPTSRSRKKRIYASFVKVRPRYAMVAEQMADTFPAKDPQRKKILNEAITDLNKIMNTTYPAATKMLATYSIASCNQKLGQPKKALTALEDIFALGNSGTKALKLKALLLACEAWQKIEPYPYDAIIEDSEEIVSLLSRGELRNPDWLRVQLELAKAKRAKAAVVKEEKRQGATGIAKSLNRDSSKLIRGVARVPSPSQAAAKKLMKEWNVGAADEDENVVVEAAKTFDEARTRVQDHMAEVRAFFIEVSALKNQAAGLAGNQAAQAPILQQLKEKRADLSAEANKALAGIDVALRLTTADTLRDDINNMRYQQAYCFFAMDQLYESALIGEFLMAKYPGVQWTAQAATLTLQSYARLFSQADEAGREFEKARIAKTANFIIGRWPGTSDSSSAASTMTKVLLSEKTLTPEAFAQADGYYNKINAESSARSTIAVMLGQRFWFERRTAKKAGAPAAQLDSLLANAQKYMIDGVKFASTEDLSYSTALTSLLLVEAYIESGDVDKAVAQLETHAIAPLDLLKQKHPAITQTAKADSFANETYKTAIKTYLAAMRRGGGDQQAWSDKASGVLAEMRNALKASNDPKANAKIAAVYRMVSDELIRQFENLKTAEEKKSFAKSLESFLSSIVNDAPDGKTILRAGSTLLSLADALQLESLTTEAKPLYAQAITALNKAEKLGFGSDKNAAAYASELKRQRALAQRGNGDYEKALDQFKQILAKSTSNLGVQVDAAMTLQMWGKNKKFSKAYAEAMMGTDKQKDPKTKRQANRIWGWRKMTMALRDKPKYKDTFNKSLYHLIEARLEYGLLEKDNKAIVSAGKELAKAKARDPDFGGENWKIKFSELEKRINSQK